MTAFKKQAINKRAVAQNFSRAAETYDKAAVLQKEIGTRLLERLDFIKISPSLILDLGGGTGSITRALGEKYPTAQIIHLDIAENMLKHAQKSKARTLNHSWICADGDRLPIKNQSVDFVFSNCMLHWLPDLYKVFQEINRILKPEGLLLFSTLGPDTLKELRFSFAKMDTQEHVHRFEDMHTIGDALLETEFLDPVMDMEIITLTYPNLNGLIRDLKLSGAQYVHPTQQQGLSSKPILPDLSNNYERFRTQAGVLPATFEVVFGHAWTFGVPTPYQPEPQETDAIPLADPKPLAR